MSAKIKPTGGFLVDFEAPTDLDHPAVVQADFAVMQIFIQLHIEDDIGMKRRWPPGALSTFAKKADKPSYLK